MPTDLQSILGVLAGIGLAAACGFRVFVPMLVAGIAVRSGALTVSDGFLWLGSTPALIALAVATVLEIGGYYLPGLDHLLDTIATPAAVVAGTIVAASFVTDAEPWFRWTLAAVAGGGAAAAVQTATVVTRTASGALTFGLGNPVVSTAELAGSAIGSVLAIVAPVVAVALLVVFLVWLVRRARRRALVPA
ncbi:MAG: DUF4126 domain-containing protein [Planctomycetes bacterium]|nr:DUF4126 domain-containing protein [Planctomycetota bacterium]